VRCRANSQSHGSPAMFSTKQVAAALPNSAWDDAMHSDTNSPRAATRSEASASCRSLKKRELAENSVQGKRSVVIAEAVAGVIPVRREFREKGDESVKKSARTHRPLPRLQYLQ
jgi:hypothetical protein